MAKELAFVLINPYTIAKSRTGGVIARYIGRTDLRLVGARMFGPCQQLVEEYAAIVRGADPDHARTCNLIADYIMQQYSPAPGSGKARRVMLLIFEGEDAVAKIWKVTGRATAEWVTGQTVRDTYGDFVVNEDNEVQYFEPAVLVGPNRDRVSKTLRLWAKYSKQDGGIIQGAMDVPEGLDVQMTLVMLKPDNFRYPSLRPGNIIDVLSTSGLRIIGVKKFSMTVAQAESFYGPVREALRGKFREIGPPRAAAVLTREFGFRVEEVATDAMCEVLGAQWADAQFEKIVQFMTGYRPSECPAGERDNPGKEDCLALIYDGVNAVTTIRGILGPTDPNQAQPGSVRREFGSDIMVNAAHASDSVENAEREIEIIGMGEDTITPLVEKYYGLD